MAIVQQVGVHGQEGGGVWGSAENRAGMVEAVKNWVCKAYITIAYKSAEICQIFKILFFLLKACENLQIFGEHLRTNITRLTTNKDFK